ncbi:hypothetical protein F0562_029475 [Nyssa sinensis]|uniref:NADP-dependent oxidoreductase domain-containing protein n=1 Tax=Nyssa sinensis TaxID=561372 RepID=A0A5J5B5A9_9ASTE|nr:hypothetical protein F0562_029475 [Nyssa sinensis]
MAEGQIVEMPRVKLGSQGLEVSRLGYGCAGLSGTYNAPVPEKDGISFIKDVFNKGITFFDTSDIYGVDHSNEILVGKALKQLPREKIQLATKFGVVKGDLSSVTVNGTPEYVRTCCEASLRRLGVEYIDLYYQHRIDTKVPIEETNIHPRFMGDNFEQNKIIYTRIEALAKKHGCSTAQLALAWLLHQGDDVVPIPGTIKIKNLDDNIGSVKVQLTKDDVKEISDAVPINKVAGPRALDSLERISWRFANTPPKDGKLSA